MPERRTGDIERRSPRRRTTDEVQRRSVDIGVDAPSRRSRSFEADDEWSNPFREDIFESSTLEPHANRQRPVDDDDVPRRTRRSYKTSTVEEIRREDDNRRKQREKPKKRHRGMKIFLIVLFFIVLVAAAISIYCSPLFEIKNIDVEGSDHLTSSDMAALVVVPQGATLLNVDADAIKESVLRDAWVEDVTVTRRFPNTLQVTVTERELAAVVEISAAEGSNAIRWAISKDGVWLMPIPDPDSEYGQSINPLIYEDADNVLTISGVPYGLVPEIGTKCTDMNVNNALDIINGLTTDLADEIKSVNATDPDSTMLILRDGVEISFGKAEDIREKERICQEILEANPGSVVYINVRVADRPTWRSV